MVIVRATQALARAFLLFWEACCNDRVDVAIAEVLTAWIAFICIICFGNRCCCVGEKAAPHHPRVLLFCSRQLV